MPDLKKNLLTGEETEAYSGLGDCVHRKLLGVIDKLHFKNHTDTFLGARKPENGDAGYPLSTQPNV